MNTPISVGILLFPDVEELDFAGPYEVFANASNQQKEPYCHVTTIGLAEEIRCRGGLRVRVDALLEECPPLDVLIVPGGPYAHNNFHNERIATLIRQQRKRATTIASVCTGAFFLAFAGLLDHQRATTHPSSRERLQQDYPQIEVVAEKVVDLGSIVTTGGVSSGIDLALHFLERWFGAEARQREARRLDGPWH
jgi:transcriptional regulator GlxA family with amidase domain